MTNYKRPPITEASFEIRIAEPLDDAQLDALNKRMQSHYETSEPIADFAVGLNVKRRETILEPRDHGYRLESKDHTDITLIRTKTFVCSRIAPYNGWESFRNSCVNGWKTWKREVGVRKIERIGLRYINRIDIPFEDKEKIDVEDYLTVVPKYPEPETVASFQRYTMQVAGLIESRDFNLVINSSIIDSPLVGHLSVVLDLDVSRQKDLPQSDAKIWEMADTMRDHKNRIFEACVTDAARELFD